MFLIYIWTYTILMILVWWFFLAIIIRYYKFRNYSNYIVPITKIFILILCIFTFLWYYLIYKTSYISYNTKTIQDATINEVY